MTIWLYDFFSPEAMVQFTGLFLVVVALAMPTLFLVRMVGLIAGLVGLSLAVFVAADRAGMFWWGLLTIIVAIRLFAGDPRGAFTKLTPRDLEFHRHVVPGLNKRRLRMLLSVGEWRTGEPGQVFTREGQDVGELVYIARGNVDIQVEGQTIGHVDAGALVGEIGVSTGESATATTVATTPVQYLAFDTDRLYPFLDNHVEIQDAIELAVDRNLREKLRRANLAAAGHPDDDDG